MKKIHIPLGDMPDVKLVPNASHFAADGKRIDTTFSLEICSI